MEAEKTVGAGRIRAFFDAGTFVELGALMRRAGDENENEGVVCGYGALDGRLVFAFAQDPDRMDGALKAGQRAARGRDLTQSAERQKVIAALARRGYDYAIARAVLEQLMEDA